MAKQSNKKPKCAKEDYQISSLPQTRAQVFFDVLKLHWKELLCISLVMLLFCFPMHLFAIIEDFNIIDINEQLTGTTAEQLAQRAYAISIAKYISALIKIPCFLIVAVAIAGFGRVIKRFSWEQHVSLTVDFSKGVKDNVGQMLLLALTVGIVNFIATYCYANSTYIEDALLSVALLVLVAFCILVLVPVAGYTVVCICLYNNTFGGHLKMAFTVYSKNPFKSLLATLCCAIPFVPQFLPFLLSHFIGRIVATILIPFVFLGWFLFALNQLDEVVNKRFYPEFVGKGIIWTEE